MTKERIQESLSRITWPEWRLYANFLHREIARLWYGKKSIFTLSKDIDKKVEFWELFGIIFLTVIAKFGEARGLTADEINKRYVSASKTCNMLLRQGLIPHSIFEIVAWSVILVLGDELASEFLFDFQITEIVILAIGAYSRAVKGKMPPYSGEALLRPIEFYEGLPVSSDLEEHFCGKPNCPKT
jgi:hypothetical protein